MFQHQFHHWCQLPSTSVPKFPFALLTPSACHFDRHIIKLCDCTLDLVLLMLLLMHWRLLTSATPFFSLFHLFTPHLDLFYAIFSSLYSGIQGDLGILLSYIAENVTNTLRDSKRHGAVILGCILESIRQSVVMSYN